MAGALLCAEEIIPQIREEFQTPPDFSRILCKKPGASHHADDLLLQPGDDPLLQPGDVGLGDAQPVRHLLLGLLLAAVQAEAQGDDRAAPGRSSWSRASRSSCRSTSASMGRITRSFSVPRMSDRSSSLPSQSVFSGSSKDTSRLLGGGLAQVHQDLVFDAAGGVGGQLDVLGRLIGAHRLDQPDGADGDQVLDVDARVLKPAGDVHHQAQVVLDEAGPGPPRPPAPGGRSAPPPPPGSGGGGRVSLPPMYITFSGWYSPSRTRSRGRPLPHRHP